MGFTWACVCRSTSTFLSETDGRVFLCPLRRMLKKSASFVLASLRGSTYRSVRLASSLAAALLDSLFEHPRLT
jgi:hypothetical protein